MFNEKEYNEIPDRTLKAINRYAKNKLRPGSFLKAVFNNDLTKAVANADLENTEALPEIVKYCYNEIPSPCWGYDGAVKDWISGGEE